MSSTVLNDEASKPAARKSLVWRVVCFSGQVARIVLSSPLRLFLSVRRSMTAASVTLLLIGIITMNIVWGYPWIGMFSACASLFFVGWTINWMMRPNLKIDFSLPNSSPAGQPFLIVTHVKNRRHFPAMDLGVGFDQSSHLNREKRGRSTSDHSDWSHTSPQSLALIRPAERRDLRVSMVNDRRGIHPLPDVVVTSMFPFHLFQSSRRYAGETCIAITPRAMTGDEDVVSRGLLNTLGGWSHRLLSGDALDYTGSREYEVGMPVRRWDFASWARLGRPIVREFQSPSIQMVTLIVDTASDVMATHGSQQESVVERVLSLAATAVTDLTRKMVRVRLYVTSESPSSLAEIEPTHSPSDAEALLIRLAAAELISPQDADRHGQQVLERIVRSPVLILTARAAFGRQHDLPPSVTILRVEPPHARNSNQQNHSRWKRSGREKLESA